ncbi:hypothetical protein HYDPIDRAFT_170227 [Hydnomerulius pinastri MD-312]|uniref:Uncharacterized protein n=1 Tax=Hydnomerulius pinastri MD-312 TaxID=994086 RepID=A0A0C9WAF2_9AGAM|nr:hypothetical protein HYDPIDRAFT_170227 [Hydnomerulius pinastri MD-312]
MECNNSCSQHSKYQRQLASHSIRPPQYNEPPDRNVRGPTSPKRTKCKASPDQQTTPTANRPPKRTADISDSPTTRDPMPNWDEDTDVGEEEENADGSDGYCYNGRDDPFDPVPTHDRQRTISKLLDELHGSLEYAIDTYVKLPKGTVIPECTKNIISKFYRRVVQPSNTNMEEMMRKLSKDVEDLKRATISPLFSLSPSSQTTQRRPNGDKSLATSNHATGPLFRSQPKKLTQDASAVALQACQVDDPMTRHHLSPLIIQPSNPPPPPDQRPSGKKIVGDFDTALELLTNVTVIAVGLNDKGNCVVIVHCKGSPSLGAPPLLAGVGGVGRVMHYSAL